MVVKVEVGGHTGRAGYISHNNTPLASGYETDIDEDHVPPIGTYEDVQYITSDFDDMVLLINIEQSTSISFGINQLINT